MRRKTETTQKDEAVTFVDTHYKQRDIAIDGARVEIRDGRVTVSDPALIAALDQLYGIKREKIDADAGSA